MSARAVLRRVTLGVAATAVAGVAVVVARQPAPPAAPLPAAPVEVRADAVSAVPAAAPAAPAVVAVPAVAPLGRLVLPDLVLVGEKTVDDATLARVRAVPGVTAVQTFDVGRVRLAGKAATVVGVDPSAFRTFTPGPTAQSDDLWSSVARGELLAEPAARAADQLALGDAVAVAGAGDVRLGSVAVLSLPGVDGLVDSSLSPRLGLVPSAGLVLATDGRALAPVRAAVAALLDPRAAVTVVTPVVPARPASGGGVTLTVPLYRAAAATCPGLPWSVLAAIGTIESNNGANPGVSSAGAQGPMQFLPATFAQYAVDGDRDGHALIDDPADAVFSAARMLCADGSPADAWASAVFAYNHAGWYVDAVLGLAARYAAA